MPKRITMADVAREAGVSKNAVSLALRHDPQIPAETRRHIQRIAKKLKYRRHPVVGELMAKLRQSQQPSFRSLLAIVNAHEDKAAFQEHPTIPTYVRGCQRQAAALGYKFDTFWMHDPELDGGALLRIFRTRGIRGAIIVGMMKRHRIPEHFLPVLNQYPCIVTGVRTREPALSFACVDHHVLALRAFERALELGYQRPGLVLDRTIDELVEGRFVAGYMTGQHDVPKSRRLRPFLQIQEARKNQKLFRDWLEREKPDVIFTLYNEVRDWLELCGKRVPQDMAIIQLEWRENHPEYPGMNQHNDVAGEAAVDMLIGAIHRGESTVPAFPRATLISPTWMPPSSGLLG